MHEHLEEAVDGIYHVHRIEGILHSLCFGRRMDFPSDSKLRGYRRMALLSVVHDLPHILHIGKKDIPDSLLRRLPMPAWNKDCMSLLCHRHDADLVPRQSGHPLSFLHHCSPRRFLQVGLVNPNGTGEPDFVLIS